MDSSLREEITILHAQVCKGLADPNRILILYTLSERPFTVNELADTVELPQPSVSRHLKVLRERGMVTAAREGQSIKYQLGDQRVIDALDLLRAFLADTLRSQVALVNSVYDISEA
jgi:ArsR family transcriptional regulator